MGGKKITSFKKNIVRVDKNNNLIVVDGGEASNDTISLCMIVKNEEINIERCLMSIKPAVHEMIVVDTGSTDRTKDIAKACGAQVYDFEWTNDFSVARNVSLSKASSNWILILDADEVISSLDHKALRELTQKKTNSRTIAYQMITRNYVDAIYTEWVANDGDYSREEAGLGWVPTEKVRLFTNDKGIQFENPVHELVEPSLSRLGGEINKSNIPIHHYGHLNPEKKKFKEGYYYLLAQKKFIESDTDLRAIYQLAVSSREFGKYEEALQYWKKFIAIKPDFPTAYCEMATNYALSDRYEEALLSLRRALQLDPTSRDITTMYAECEIIIGNFETAICHLDHFLMKDSTYPMAMLTLAAAYFCAGKKEKGMAYVKKLRDIKFNCADYFSDFAKTLISVKRLNYAHSLLQAAIESNNTTKETPLLLDECTKILLDSEQ
jgi:O-antigen biosynthesis protein